jgi:hypothetical protein
VKRKYPVTVMLAEIHASVVNIPVKPQVIQQLHRDMCKNTYLPQPGGRWKHSDNVIEEKLADGTKRIRFVPVKAFLAPSAMDELCDSFNTYRAKGEWMDISCPIFP